MKFVGEVDCHRAPKPDRVIEEKSWKLAIRSPSPTRIIGQIAAQNRLNHPVAGIVVSDGDRFQEKQHPKGQVSIRVIRPSDSVNEVVAKDQVPESACCSGFGLICALQLLPNAVECQEMLLINLA